MLSISHTIYKVHSLRLHDCETRSANDDDDDDGDDDAQQTGCGQRVRRHTKLASSSQNLFVASARWTKYFVNDGLG